jgi:hypothetical protein
MRDVRNSCEGISVHQCDTVATCTINAFVMEIVEDRK